MFIEYVQNTYGEWFWQVRQKNKIVCQGAKVYTSMRGAKTGWKKFNQYVKYCNVNEKG